MKSASLPFADLKVDVLVTIPPAQAVLSTLPTEKNTLSERHVSPVSASYSPAGTLIDDTKLAKAQKRIERTVSFMLL